jgi:hypothetical protein
MALNRDEVKRAPQRERVRSSQSSEAAGGLPPKRRGAGRDAASDGTTSAKKSGFNFCTPSRSS